MAKEIERKFLVKEELWTAEKGSLYGTLYLQAYLCRKKKSTVRVRVVSDKAYLTLKGESKGATRQEFEYEIPLEDGRAILSNLVEGRIIEKTRYRHDFDGLTWEVDQFYGDNEGLLLAEVELNSEDQRIGFPPWVGEEVTGDERYYNANLISNPYKNWKSE